MKTWREVAAMGGGKEIESGSLRLRPNWLAEVGERIAGDIHHFDHTTFFLQGEFDLIATTRGGEFIAQEHIIAPDLRLILANVRHTIIARVPNCAFWCAYAHRDAQGEVVARCLGYMQAYT